MFVGAGDAQSIAVASCGRCVVVEHERCDAVPVGEQCGGGRVASGPIGASLKTNRRSFAERLNDSGQILHIGGHARALRAPAQAAFGVDEQRRRQDMVAQTAAGRNDIVGERAVVIENARAIGNGHRGGHGTLGEALDELPQQLVDEDELTEERAMRRVHGGDAGAPGLDELVRKDALLRHHKELRGGPRGTRLGHRSHGTAGQVADRAGELRKGELDVEALARCVRGGFRGFEPIQFVENVAFRQRRAATKVLSCETTLKANLVSLSYRRSVCGDVGIFGGGFAFGFALAFVAFVAKHRRNTVNDRISTLILQLDVQRSTGGAICACWTKILFLYRMGKGRPRLFALGHRRQRGVQTRRHAKRHESIDSLADS